MAPARTNEDWLDALRRQGAAQARALEDLRAYLLRALPACLEKHGPPPDGFVEDVVQDALVRTLDQLDRFEGRSGFRTWATAIAVRVALTELRRRRWKDVSLDALSAAEAHPWAHAVDPGAGPETQAAQSRIVDVMRELVTRELTERQRTALLAEMQGLPQEEIGRRLGIRRNAVYKLGHDARKKLKRGMQAAGFDAADIREAFSEEPGDAAR